MSFHSYKNKAMTAKNPDGQVVATIVIIDDALKLQRDPEFDPRETYARRYDTKAEYEHERINKILMGQIVQPVEGDKQCPQ